MLCLRILLKLLFNEETKKIVLFCGNALSERFLKLFLKGEKDGFMYFMGMIFYVSLELLFNKEMKNILLFDGNDI
jgi:hypothetical protein